MTQHPIPIISIGLQYVDVDVREIESYTDDTVVAYRISDGFKYKLSKKDWGEYFKDGTFVLYPSIGLTLTMPNKSVVRVTGVHVRTIIGTDFVRMRVLPECLSDMLVTEHEWYNCFAQSFEKAECSTVTDHLFEHALSSASVAPNNSEGIPDTVKSSIQLTQEYRVVEIRTGKVLKIAKSKEEAVESAKRHIYNFGRGTAAILDSGGNPVNF
jgi:hypothetical protein